MTTNSAVFAMIAGRRSGAALLGRGAVAILSLAAAAMLAAACGGSTPDPTPTPAPTATPTPAPTATPVPVPTATPSAADSGASSDPVPLADIVFTAETTGKDVMDGLSEAESTCIQDALGAAVYQLFLGMSFMAAASAAGGEDSPLEGCLTPENAAILGAVFAGAQSGETGDDDSDDDSGSSDDSDDDQTVSRQNPGFAEVGFDDARSPALIDAVSLDAVRWTVEPVISGGELVAEGVLEKGAMIFTPMMGEGSAFSVYYKGSREPMVEVLPDLGPMQIWKTDHTVAPMSYFELEGTSFKFRANSPLFMDVGSPSELELRVFGFDDAGADSLLSVQDIGTE